MSSAGPALFGARDPWVCQMARCSSLQRSQADTRFPPLISNPRVVADKIQLSIAVNWTMAVPRSRANSKHQRLRDGRYVGLGSLRWLPKIDESCNVVFFLAAPR
ncbi:unnamed protein product [Effrenium voratum]|uniref:Uncharacterized protein n=1 Tax=Effrenium voratum TaxID=2562239 RepID=A0AA36I6U7_9DINO|nr:unnamed protein product [Effrenium voratum]